MFSKQDIQKYVQSFKPREDIVVDILAGPSGIGKNWIADQLQSSHKLILSTTSRPKRADEDEEESGYEFISPTEFEDSLKKGEFATTLIIKNNYYGYRIQNLEAIIKTGKIPLAIVYPYVLDGFIEKFPNSRIWFLYPTPQKKDEYLTFLEERMRRRNESEDTIAFRLKDSIQQIEDLFGDDYEKSKLGKYRKRENTYFIYIDKDSDGAEAVKKIKEVTK